MPDLASSELPLEPSGVHPLYIGLQRDLNDLVDQVEFFQNVFLKLAVRGALGFKSILENSSKYFNYNIVEKVVLWVLLKKL